MILYLQYISGLPRGIRRDSAASRLLGLRVRIPQCHGEVFLL